LCTSFTIKTSVLIADNHYLNVHFNSLIMETTINEEGRYKVLTSRYLFKRPWLTARLDSARLPDGREVPEYYVLEYPDWINVIAITEDGRMIMERQYRHGIGKTAYELPCGVIEKGEDPLIAAKRELQEETGYGDGNWTLLMGGAPNPGSQNNYCHSFLATGVRKISGQNLDATEDISVHLMDVAQVRSLLERGEILQILHAAPLWKFFASIS